MNQPSDPKPLPKAKKLTYLDSEFHYVPSRPNMNQFTTNKLEVKLNENYKRILNYFSYDQSNTNTSNINHTIENIDSTTKLPPNKTTPTLTYHIAEKNRIQQQQQQQQLNQMKTKQGFYLNKNIKLKLSSTTKEAKCPLIIKQANNSKSNHHQQQQNANLVKMLFNTFLTKIKANYPLLYPELYSYCLLSSSSISNPEEKEITKLFKNIFRKFYSRTIIKQDDLSSNTLFLSTIECLLNDYYSFIAKSQSSFIHLFLECYKEVVVANYGIISRQVNDKLEGIKQYEEDIGAFKAKIEELQSTIFDLDNKMNLIDLDNQKYQSIVIHQRDETEGLKEEIEQLKNTIQIKNYELHELNKKTEDQLKDNLEGGLLIKANDYEEKLDLDKLLKNRLERIKFNTFKKDVIFKKKGESGNDNLTLNTINNKANTNTNNIINNSDEDRLREEDDEEEEADTVNNNPNTYRDLREIE